ncbi:hypothetical protein PSTT_16832 [Puccinia striiformis]|uniref:SUN domain-containing protein n=1 Tax=Puccinia striiformis TaxID=27350 RepID=A0A2S4UB43_9BASI|nr:hypothetical protein PSTT_16832 [Puccinia striiformis]
MFKLIKLTVPSSSAEPGVEVGYLKTHVTRGLQVFNIKHLKGFYRYTRLDFINYYGSEYFCPLSLVRIYGLTQIDAYGRDEKLAMIKLKEEEQLLSNLSALYPVLYVPENLSFIEAGQKEVYEEELGGHQKEEEEKVSDELEMDPVTPLTKKEETINKQESVVDITTTTTSSDPPQELYLEQATGQHNPHPLEEQSNKNLIGNTTKEEEEEVKNLIKIKAQSSTPPPPIQLVNNLPGNTNSCCGRDSECDDYFIFPGEPGIN